MLPHYRPAAPAVTGRDALARRLSVAFDLFCLWQSQIQLFRGLVVASHCSVPSTECTRPTGWRALSLAGSQPWRRRLQPSATHIYTRCHCFASKSFVKDSFEADTRATDRPTHIKVLRQSHTRHDFSWIPPGRVRSPFAVRGSGLAAFPSADGIDRDQGTSIGALERPGQDRRYCDDCIYRDEATVATIEFSRNSGILFGFVMWTGAGCLGMAPANVSITQSGVRAYT